MLNVEKIKHRESRVYRRANLHSSRIHHSSRPRYSYIRYAVQSWGGREGGRRGKRSKVYIHPTVMENCFSRIICSSDRTRVPRMSYRLRWGKAVASKSERLFLERYIIYDRPLIAKVENLSCDRFAISPRNFISSRTSAHAFHIDRFRNSIFAPTPTYVRTYEERTTLG